MRQTMWSVLFALSVMGCGIFGKGGESPPSPIDVVVKAAPRLNPDDRGESLPALVRVYQLKSAAKLASAPVEQLYRSAKEVLGDDLLQVDEILLTAGATERRRIERDKAARLLAVVPLVRHPTGTSWRSVVELPPADQAGRFAFLVEGYRVDRQSPEERR